MGRLFDGMVSDLCQVSAKEVVGLVFSAHESRACTAWADQGGAVQTEPTVKPAASVEEGPTHG